MLGFLFVELYETIKSIAIVNRERGRAVLWEFSFSTLQKCSQSLHGAQLFSRSIFFPLVYIGIPFMEIFVLLEQELCHEWLVVPIMLKGTVAV